jgi:ParB/RepB/Spo0J family partition protein
MKLRRVDPNTIKVPETRVTAQFDEELLAMFKASIREVGQTSPILCCQVDSDLILVDGLHRLMEAITNKTPRIDVNIFDGDMVDVLTKNIFVDHLRGKTPPSEMVKVIEALWKEFDLDSEQIAKRTGLSRDYVEKLQLISQLTPYCKAALDEGRIGVGHAAALTKIKDPARQETILGQVELYHWTVKATDDFVREVNRIVNKPEEVKAPGEALPPPKIKCRFCDIEYDITQISNPNLCTSCAGELLMIQTEARRAAEQEAKRAEELAQVPDEETETS